MDTLAILSIVLGVALLMIAIAILVLRLVAGKLFDENGDPIPLNFNSGDLGP